MSWAPRNWKCFSDFFPVAWLRALGKGFLQLRQRKFYEIGSTYFLFLTFQMITVSEELSRFSFSIMVITFLRLLTYLMAIKS